MALGRKRNKRDGGQLEGGSESSNTPRRNLTYCPPASPQSRRVAREPAGPGLGQLCASSAGDPVGVRDARCTKCSINRFSSPIPAPSSRPLTGTYWVRRGCAWFFSQLGCPARYFHLGRPRLERGKRRGQQPVARVWQYSMAIRPSPSSGSIHH
ncbi:hypothetical protein BGZ61DRAFT_232426 [Ilyonectria robusta]|uniref:uncharacterized protein n=1 Tax=Ilyonectria robusta TaxID=1079257 RepID=UPI001E8EED16|nr:uncharacterized protein BGZ61DRAFT_232426 [Ilyonectria robusta]KAH8699500.1 hypothetical protein BGZ61DRAFT_232426 [Ilyonectria robusta]